MEDPCFFFLHWADHDIQSQLEEYQEIALREWLPTAIEDPRSEAGRAIRKLADLLADQHSDPWLKDFLQVTGPGDVPTLEALGQALDKNSEGLYGEAAERAREAQAGFSVHHNTPGELRARREGVYAEQRVLKGRDCVAHAAPLIEKLSLTRYGWLQAQLALDEAACMNMGEEFSNALDEVKASMVFADKDAFPVLKLRILGLSASIKRRQKNYSECWQENVKGLSLYSQGRYPVERLYQFYSVMAQYAEDRQLLYAQNSLLRQALALQQALPAKDQDIVLQAAIYLTLSNNLTIRRQSVPAQAALREAELRLKKVSETHVQSYVLTTQIKAARYQMDLNVPENARLILESSRYRLSAVQDNFIALDFYQQLGDSNRLVGRLDDATVAYGSGIAIAEKALGTMPLESERLKWTTGTDGLYRGLISNLLEQQKAEAALQLWEWYRNRTSDRMSAGSASWDKIRRDIFKSLPLSGPTTRLVYVLLQNQLRIWVVKAGKIETQSVRLDPEDLRRKVADFATACSTASSDAQELRGMGQVLGAIFLQPVSLEMAQADTVIIELDPRLSRLPIAALLDPGGRYFADRHAIVISPGMFAEASLRIPEPLRKDLRFTLMDASFSGGLPGHDAEKGAIREAFPRISVAVPSDAPWSMVRREVEMSEGFAFIGHGRSSGTGTALMYGKESLGAREFSPELLKHLNVAVLTACSSASGGDLGFLETDNLVHSFLLAGVPNVIASNWNVDSRSTGDLMAHFYRNLERGDTVPMALAGARRDLRGRKNHPYYWAAFDLVGRVN